MRNIIPRRIAVVSLSISASLLGDSALYTILPAHAEQLGIRLALVGILLSANRFIRLLSNSWAGRIHDRFHSPYPFVAALIVGACITAIYGFFLGFWTFFIARLLWGICWSFLRMEGYSSVIIEADPNARGRLMGTYKSIITLGFMAGGFLGGVLTDTIGYSKCMLLFACISLIGAFAALLGSPRSLKSQEGKEPGKQIPSSEISDRDTHSPDVQLRKTRSPEYWVIYLLGFTNILVSSSVIGSTLGRLLRIRFGMSVSIWQTSLGVASATGVLSMLRRTTSLILAPILGSLADRAGRRFVLILGLVITIAALILIATQHSFMLIGVAAVACSVSYTAISISLDASIADTVSAERRGQLVSRYVTFTDLGSACGPLISYLLLSVQVGIEYLYLGGLLLLVAACILYGLRVWGDRGMGG